MNAPARNLPSRRELFIVAGAVAGGGLVVGCAKKNIMADALSLGADPKIGPFGPFLAIAADGAVTVVSKHIEVGQGSPTGLAAIVAEELDADWNTVSVVQAPADTKVYMNFGMGAQGTGGSSAIRNSWMQLRKVGAAGRAMFVSAAAQRWSVPAGEITVKDSIVSHPTGKTASFAALVADAAKMTPPQDPPLKDPKTFTLIGTERVRRKDARAKSTGGAQYTQDVHRPDMLVAMVAHSPRFGGKVKSFDDSAARKITGVVDVVRIPTGVAVLAADTFTARRGRDALSVQWDESKAEMRSSDAILAHYHDLASGRAAPSDGAKWQTFEAHGSASPPAGGKVIEVGYDFPYLAHAPMEPMNCVAEVGKGPTRIATGSQSPTLDQLNTALITGELPGSVQIQNLFAGGSFGRRTNFKSDFVSECVHIAKHVDGGRPVKLVWAREDDMTGGYYRPLTHHAVRVTLGADGFPAHWRHRVVTQSIMRGSPIGAGKIDATSVEGALGSPYLAATPNVDAQVVNPISPVTVLWWRSVGATHTAFVMEHTIDQLARAAGKDPVAYRLALFEKAGAQRHVAALQLAVSQAGPATPGWARGVAVHESFGSVVAQIAEAKLDGGEPRVGRVITAIDCGFAVAPDQIAAQMEGGTCYGLSAALYGQITLKDGIVQQRNFDAYRVLRFSEAPRVETHVVPSSAQPSGVGEPGTPVIAPAVANALLSLTGKPTFSLPFVTT